MILQADSQRFLSQSHLCRRDQTGSIQEYSHQHRVTPPISKKAINVRGHIRFSRNCHHLHLILTKTGCADLLRSVTNSDHKITH